MFLIEIVLCVPLFMVSYRHRNFNDVNFVFCSVSRGKIKRTHTLYSMCLTINFPPRIHSVGEGNNKTVKFRIRVMRLHIGPILQQCAVFTTFWRFSFFLSFFARLQLALFLVLFHSRSLFLLFQPLFLKHNLFILWVPDSAWETPAM